MKPFWHGWRLPKRGRWALELPPLRSGLPDLPIWSLWLAALAWVCWHPWSAWVLPLIVSGNTLANPEGATTSLGPPGNSGAGIGQPVSTNTIDASQFSGTRESRIQQAIDRAGALNLATGLPYYVWIPLSMLPYTASLVTFNAAIVMLREAGTGIGVDIQAYGADPLGVQDASAAITGATNVTGGNAIWVPRGTYLSRSATVNFSNQAVMGEGMGISIIKFQATATNPNFGGMSIRGSNVTFENVSFQLDVNGQVAVNALSFDAAASNIVLRQVEFKGLQGTGTRALLINGFTVTEFVCDRCRFDTIQFALLKPNADTSVQKSFKWTTCYFVGGADGINVNSPLGAFTDVNITDCDFDTMSNFSIAFAGASCKRATVKGCHFRTLQIEGVHVEASASEVKILGNDFVDCNKANTYGTSGAVNIITGAHHVTVQGNNIDLTSNLTVGTGMYGIVAQAGGGAAPFHLDIIGNTFECYDTVNAAVLLSAVYGTVLSDNHFTNPTTIHKVPVFVDISASKVHGQDNVFYNPAALFKIDTNSFGTLSRSHIDGDLTSFAMATGAGVGNNASVCIDGFTILRSFTANAGATGQNLFPTGIQFDGTVGLRFQQSGTGSSWVESVKLTWDGTTMRLTDLISNQGASASAAPTAPPGFAQWLTSGGNVQAGSFNAGGVTGIIVVTFAGVYFP